MDDVPITFIEDVWRLACPFYGRCEWFLLSGNFGRVAEEMSKNRVEANVTICVRKTLKEPEIAYYASGTINGVFYPEIDYPEVLQFHRYFKKIDIDIWDSEMTGIPNYRRINVDCPLPVMIRFFKLFPHVKVTTVAETDVLSPIFRLFLEHKLGCSGSMWIDPNDRSMFEFFKFQLGSVITTPSSFNRVLLRSKAEDSAKFEELLFGFWRSRATGELSMGDDNVDWPLLLHSWNRFDGNRGASYKKYLSFRAENLNNVEHILSQDANVIVDRRRWIDGEDEGEVLLASSTLPQDTRGLVFSEVQYQFGNYIVYFSENIHEAKKLGAVQLLEDIIEKEKLSQAGHFASRSPFDSDFYD
ncbi:hypothetical protein QR680_004219 [Steinernema hermaphroditum]|uniref:Uncharacterized protein n=1 Tax=Steinernema hermaphroditum TaxID=289476 RepID=A0AA39HPE7_9BILA|nr:hypothetical protein QR680_004219 [Steinernema hermaphroditum]